MRKPKRKKSRFVYKKKSGKIIVQNGSVVWTKEVARIVYMGDFGYHTALNLKWTVFHIPTGLDIAYTNTEKEARIMIKKLFVKIKTINWKASCFDHTVKLMGLSVGISNTLNTEKISFEKIKFEWNADADIPF